MFADVHVIDRTHLLQAVATALADLNGVGVITGDLATADARIVDAIQHRWTVFTDTPPGSAVAA